MFDKIAKIISEKNLKASDCGYHTLRELENGGKIRALVLKGDSLVHVEYICPKCSNYGYKTQEWGGGKKTSKLRFETKCDKCGNTIKVEKLKGKK